MKHFLVTYKLKNGMEAPRHEAIDEFIAAIDADPELQGKLSYRCLRRSDVPDYYHFVAATEEAAKALQSRDFFSRYTDQTEESAQGEVEVFPLELIAETAATL